MKAFVIFNEAKKRKAKRLIECCIEQLRDCQKSAGTSYSCPNKDASENNCSFKVIYADEDFQNLFQSLSPALKELAESPQFMFLDQYGIKHVTREVFSSIINLKRTDFLFFISSSFVARFIELPEFASYIQLTREVFKENDSMHCHRVICDYYRSLIPKGEEYYIAPFSIKKSKNIYGLIFGSHNLLGLQKFLECAWDTDSNTGEANFNIDNDEIVSTLQLSIFPQDNVVRKLDYYQNELISWLKEEHNNMDIKKFSLLHGFLPKHTNEILTKLEKDDKLVVQPVNSEKKRSGAFYLNDNATRIIVQYKK